MTKQEAQEILDKCNRGAIDEADYPEDYEMWRWIKDACETIVRLDEWQPIETAPKNGEHILLLENDGVKIGRWNNTVNNWTAKITTFDSPKLWRQTPSAPKEKE